MAAVIWEVVGGTDKGGILVRSGKDLSAAAETDRLRTGSRLRELDRDGERIQYELLSGSGPSTGWVSLRVKGKDLLASVTADEPSLNAPSPKVASSKAASPKAASPKAAQSAAADASPVAVVTGANKGIGFEIAKKLVAAKLRVVVACRSRENGMPAARALRCEFELLDVDSEASIKDFAERVAARYGRLDILVNNAATIGVPSTPFAQRTEPTLRTNFYGLMTVTDALMPLLKASAASGGHPRIVNLASDRGHLSQLRGNLQAKFSSPTLNREGLLALVKKFRDDVKAGCHSEEGWGDSNYGFSKLAVIALTKVLARETGTAVKVNAVNPGYCITDMTGGQGTRSAEVGARTPAMLALLPDSGPTGNFYMDERPIAW